MAKAQLESRLPSVGLINALADAEGVDPTNLDYNIYEHIDLDALDALLTEQSTGVHLSFEVAEHTVGIDADGSVTVDGDEYRWGAD